MTIAEAIGEGDIVENFQEGYEDMKAVKGVTFFLGKMSNDISNLGTVLNMTNYLLCIYYVISLYYDL